MKLAIVGHGSIAAYVFHRLKDAGIPIEAAICRPGRQAAARHALADDVTVVTAVADLPFQPDLLLDCAGHGGLRAHGVAALGRGIEVFTVATGALADATLYAALTEAAQQGGTRLCLASGAIGALDALSAAAVGGLDRVTYRGRKPPAGWKGSAAEAVLDIDALSAPTVHFEGTAREAALRYPKNANVAASVALAGLGFEQTRAVLIADPTISANIHEIEAQGAFGTFSFRIEGRPLPGNPRSSALTAMNMVAEVIGRTAAIGR